MHRFLTLAAFAVPLLACSGLFTPELAPRSFSVGTISTLDATVSKDQDWGTQGDFSTERGSLYQQVQWLTADDPLADTAASFWRVSRGLLQQLGQGGVPETPALVDSTVAGEPAVGWHMKVGVESIHFVAWRCPVPNVTMSVTTAGPSFMADQTHRAAVATATCGTQPVARDPASIAWEYVGGDGWTAQPDQEPGRGLWTRADEAVVASVEATDPLLPQDGVDPCKGALDEIMVRMDGTFAVDPGSVRDRPGCSRSFAGTSDGEPIRAVFSSRACDTERAYVLFCLIYDPAAPLEACDEVVRCRDAG